MIVNTTAIKGAAYVHALDGCGRFSSVNMRDLCIMGTAKHQTNLFHAQAGSFNRRGQFAFVQGGKAVGDFDQLIKVLTDHHNGGPAGRQIKQGLTNGRRSRGINAQIRLIDEQDIGLW
jgi:hypothetical protein